MVPLLLEASVDGREVAESLDEEQRREDQHQRHRDLRNDEPALKSGAVAIDGQAARSLAHGGERIDDRHTERREQSEEDRRQRGDRADERDQPPVGREIAASTGCVDVSRNATSARPESSATGRASAAPPAATSRLSISICDTSRRPRRADGDAHGDLALAGARTREHERGEIAAGDEKHQAGQTEQQRQRRAMRVAQAADAAAGREHAEPEGGDMPSMRSAS